MQIKKATKSQSKARVALVGVSGAGKTYTALRLAQGLGNRILLIDTENASASKYADEFEFDTIELSTFHPQTYVQALQMGQQAGYDVIVIDSLSHAWMGKDGALEQVDRVTARSQSKNSFASWREVTPMHNALVDALVHCKAHLIVTMRAKSEYVMQEVVRNGRTKTEPVKVGLAPIQRDGIEYEFDVVADIDIDHQFIVSKTRCKALDGFVIKYAGQDVGKTLLEWLTDGVPEKTPQSATEIEYASTETTRLIGQKWSGHFNRPVNRNDIAEWLHSEGIDTPLTVDGAYQALDKLNDLMKTEIAPDNA